MTSLEFFAQEYTPPLFAEAQIAAQKNRGKGPMSVSQHSPETVAGEASASIELSVVIPCLNEQLNIPELVHRLLNVFSMGQFSGEVILVDDGSTDDTAQVIRKLASEHPNQVRGCFHSQNRGIAAAWRTGAAAARGVLISVMDADLQYQPEDLLRLRRTLYDSSVDVVQGFRSQVGRQKDKRYHLSRGLNRLLNGIFGMSLRDNKSGFLMCSREVFLDLITYEGTYFYWQSFIMVAAYAKGYSYREIETLFESRKQGVSFLDGSRSLVASAKTFYDLGVAALEYRVSRRPPDISEQYLRRNPVPSRAPERDPLSEIRWRSYMATFDKTHWMITRDVEAYYETLQRTQWLTPSQTKELQDEKLRRLVRHAYRNVPYYRAKMQAVGLHPEDIRGQADLSKLPMLSKEDVRKHLYFDMMSETHDKSQILKISTSGSTGEPFVCYADRSQLEFRWAATLRAQEWTGYRFGDPCVRLWHQTLGMSLEQVVREHLDALFCNRTFIPVFALSDKNLDEMIRKIEDANPTLIDGYAEAFDFLARYLSQHAKQSTMRLKPRALMSSAQTLPASSRKLIEESFGCRVFDKYGSREFSGIAYECEAHDGHHVVAEGYLVEILVGNRPAEVGEVGEVVITDLNNYCMPFVRYRIGDLAEAMSQDLCSCGRGAPRIGRIEGRVQSIIQGVDGQYIPGTFFAHYLKEFDYAIKRFQVIQEERGAIRFLVVKGQRYSQSILDQILDTFRKHLGTDMRIQVEFVEDIALVRTGKHMSTVSKIPIDFQRDVIGVSVGGGKAPRPAQGSSL
ncbi:MAG TPA: glycosyltransferase [Pseudomonadota bacterium]|nr:glycosyltransferase [Pseudomonadota bacterium]